MRTGGESVGYLPGIFDFVTVEHLDELDQARAQCDLLFTGVLSDIVCAELLDCEPTNPYPERLEIVRALTGVEVVLGQLTSDMTTVWSQLQFSQLFLRRDSPLSSVVRHRALADAVQFVTLEPRRISDSALQGSARL